jgi:hypothetical protein
LKIFFPFARRTLLNLSIFTIYLYFSTKNQNTQESLTFLDELTNVDELDKRAIIIVPETFTPGNICLENAYEFLFNAK